jgi:hypothetical protein
VRKWPGPPATSTRARMNGSTGYCGICPLHGRARAERGVVRVEVPGPHLPEVPEEEEEEGRLASPTAGAAGGAGARGAPGRGEEEDHERPQVRPMNPPRAPSAELRDGTPRAELPHAGVRRRRRRSAAAIACATRSNSPGASNERNRLPARRMSTMSPPVVASARYAARVFRSTPSGVGSRRLDVVRAEPGEHRQGERHRRQPRLRHAERVEEREELEHRAVEQGEVLPEREQHHQPRRDPQPPHHPPPHAVEREPRQHSTTGADVVRPRS